MNKLNLSLSKIRTKKNIITITTWPIWELVPIIRTDIKKILHLILTNESRIDQITIAASELLENAVKYSVSDKISFSMAFSHQPKQIEISVINKTKASHAKQLLAIIKAMKQKNQEQFYLQKLRKQHNNLNISRKGIARINYETGAKVKVTYGKDKVIKVRLIFELAGKSNESN